MCLNSIRKNNLSIFPSKFFNRNFLKSFYVLIGNWLKLFELKIRTFNFWQSNCPLENRRNSKFIKIQNDKKNIHRISIKNCNLNSTNDKYHNHETSKHIFQPNFTTKMFELVLVKICLLDMSCNYFRIITRSNKWKKVESICAVTMWVW